MYSAIPPNYYLESSLEIIIIGTLSCLITLVSLAIIACLCGYRKWNIGGGARQLTGGRRGQSSAASPLSLHHNTSGKSLYLASDIKTVPSDEVDTLNRQFMLLKRCSQTPTSSSGVSKIAASESAAASTRNRATSSLGEGLKAPAVDKTFSTPTSSELKMPTQRSHRPASTVKIVEVTSSTEERQKMRRLPRRK
ncbi:hypothetical protein TYRP_001946 [Tyrophagus putrescentiae]|nr:hypothetical protein TYRP_001946 [Tyrophagus putrescentiae]